MVTLRGVGSAAFTQVMEVTDVEVWCGWMGRGMEEGSDAARQRESERMSSSERRRGGGEGKVQQGAAFEALLTLLLMGMQI